MQRFFKDGEGPRFLDSYSLERKPVAMTNVKEASEMRAGFETQVAFSAIMEENSEEGQQQREKAREAILRTRAKEFQNDSAGIEFGYRYSKSPICIPDGPDPRRTIRAIIRRPPGLERARRMFG